MALHQDIQYGSGSPLLRFDLHVPPTTTRDSPLLVFVHGGAWRSEDKKDHASLASELATASHCPVLVPNYRLTPNAPTESNHFRHPGHAEDILQFLVFLTAWEGVPSVFDPAGRTVYVLGHSAGAHILASIFLDSSAVSPTLTPPPAVRQAVRGVVMSEGIYDIDLLLRRFPDYREWFIASVFGDRQDYADVSVTQMPLRKPESDLRWLVIHSTGDTLVDVPQTDAMYEHLRALYGSAADVHVTRNTDRLDMDHNDILRSPLFVDIIREFVAAVQ
ncbi:Alpha/Beta hydrolase protein [Mycena crocata]|nr:Alpha/Beta hydrolase protein [Mycena crocata]